jgi:hypothetical protein
MQRCVDLAVLALNQFARLRSARHHRLHPQRSPCSLPLRAGASRPARTTSPNVNRRSPYLSVQLVGHPYESASWPPQSDSDSVPSTHRSRSDSRWSGCRRGRAPAAGPASPVLPAASRRCVPQHVIHQSQLQNAGFRAGDAPFRGRRARNPCGCCDEDSGSLLFAQPQHGALPAASRLLGQRSFQQIDCGCCRAHPQCLHFAIMG